MKLPMIVLNLFVAVSPAFAQQPKPGVATNPEVETAKDELELLEAQLEVRKAALKVITGRADAAKDTVDRLERAGGVSRVEMAKAVNEAEALKGEVALRTAELREHELKITIAKRKVERAQAKTATPAAKDPVREFLEALLKNQNQLLEWEKEDRAARAKSEKEQQRLEEAAKKREAEAQLAREKEHAKQLAEQKKATLEASLKQLTVEIEQANSKLKLTELKAEQLKLELETIRVQAEEIKALRFRLESFRKDLEKQLQGDGK